MIVNMSFLQKTGVNDRMGATYSGLYGADRLPRRYAQGFFECAFPDPHLLLPPNQWEEFPDFSPVDKYKTSFGVYDDADQFYRSGILIKMEASRNYYCCLGITADPYGYAQDLIPKDFGPYYGTQAPTPTQLSNPIKHYSSTYFFYSVFRFLGAL